MNLSHYSALLISYGSALILWVLIARQVGELWNREPCEFTQPAREFGFALVACIVVIGVGQLFVHGLLIPPVDGLGALIGSLNQVLIFSPVLIFLWMRSDGPASAWLPMDRLLLRNGIGITLSVIVVILFAFAREGARPILQILADTYSPRNLRHLTQVFLEDVTIAVLFVRLRAWIGNVWSIGAVAVLFAAGHIPAMLSGGALFNELGTLILDAALAVAVLSVLQRARDIWWFWWIHFALDMMQYYAV